MSVLSRLRPALVLAAIAAAAPALLAADPVPTASSSSGAPPAAKFTDRLFLSFAQDAAIVPSQWWEGEIEYSHGSSDFPVDVFLVRAQVAFRPVQSLEVGGDVGFATSHASDNLPDGTGATDLDAYAKWVFSDVAQNTDMTAGVLLTIPTGDDQSGLGFNAFSSQAFGGVRYRMDSVVIGGHVGFRFNGDGEFQGVHLQGKPSFELAVNAIFPLANRVSIVAESKIETTRWEHGDSATQLLAGVNWQAFGRGWLRAAVAGGLTSGAPDYFVRLSYVYTF
jgi:hypothetical protein